MVLDAATQNAFLRALDEDPAFYEAVRRRVLGDELLALPQILADFIAATDRRLTTLETTLTEFTTEQREFNRQTLEHQKRTDEHFQRLDERADRADERADRIEARLDRVIDDLAFVKGHVIGRAAQDFHEQILEQLGFNFVKMLSRNDLVSMLRSADSADIPFGDRRSFYNADVVLQVSDQHNATHYVAVEASFTADHRDTDRAIRNSEFLTRFMGCPAHPVIVSVSNDREIQPLLDAQTVHWFHIDERDIQPN